MPKAIRQPSAGKSLLRLEPEIFKANLRLKLKKLERENPNLEVELWFFDEHRDDRKPVPDLVQFLFGKIFADHGYISQPLAAKLLQNLGIQFFAKPRRNIRSRHGRVSRPCAIDLLKNRLMLLSDKLLARKRSIIETVIDQLKNISQIEVRPRVVLSLSRLSGRRKGTRTFEHSRHRSPVNFGVNILCGSIAYCYQPKKPSLYLEQDLVQYA